MSADQRIKNSAQIGRDVPVFDRLNQWFWSIIIGDVNFGLCLFNLSVAWALICLYAKNCKYCCNWSVVKGQIWSTLLNGAFLINMKMRWITTDIHDDAHEHSDVFEFIGCELKTGQLMKKDGLKIK